MKTRTLTLSALSASLATVVLILGTVFAEALDLFAVIIAPVILAMPLYIDSIKGSLLATLVGMDESGFAVHQLDGALVTRFYA